VWLVERTRERGGCCILDVEKDISSYILLKTSEGRRCNDFKMEIILFSIK